MSPLLMSSQNMVNRKKKVDRAWKKKEKEGLLKKGNENEYMYLFVLMINLLLKLGALSLVLKQQQSILLPVN